MILGGPSLQFKTPVAAACTLVRKIWKMQSSFPPEKNKQLIKPDEKQIAQYSVFWVGAGVFLTNQVFW